MPSEKGGEGAEALRRRGRGRTEREPEEENEMQYQKTTRKCQSGDNLEEGGREGGCWVGSVLAVLETNPINFGRIERPEAKGPTRKDN